MKVIAPQTYKVFPKLTDSEVRVMLAVNNSKCPLNRIVVSDKNEGAMHALRLIAFKALKKEDRSCRGANFGIYAGPGQGKTHVVKAFAETIEIPCIMIQSDALETTWQLFEEIQKEFTAQGFPLVPQTSPEHFIVPPCIVFFDEAHGLPKQLRTCGLLNAMEYNDGWLAAVPPKGGTAYMIDCMNVCWIGASTDPGLIFSQSEAFHSRLGMHLIWNAAGKEEVARIIRHNHPNMPQVACDLVAHYQQVPRKAISFANQMLLEISMMNCTWEEAAAKIAEVNGIDEYGMPSQQLSILKALGQRPIAKKNLTIHGKCRIEELERIILPPLLDEADNRGSLVGITGKGYAITRAGLKELDKRGIAHKGDPITFEAISD